MNLSKLVLINKLILPLFAEKMELTIKITLSQTKKRYEG